jgi:hypothetical protein
MFDRDQTARDVLADLDTLRQRPLGETVSFQVHPPVWDYLWNLVLCDLQGRGIDPAREQSITMRGGSKVIFRRESDEPDRLHGTWEGLRHVTTNHVKSPDETMQGVEDACMQPLLDRTKEWIQRVLDERRAQLDADAERILNMGLDSAKAAMYGGGVMGPFLPDPDPPTFVEQPLAVKPGPAWQDREQRVEWCIANLTAGEKAYLYRLLHNDGLRLDNCKDRERREKDSLK